MSEQTIDIGDIRNLLREDLIIVGKQLWGSLSADDPSYFVAGLAVAEALHERYEQTDEAIYNQESLECLQAMFSNVEKASREEMAKMAEICAKSFTAQGFIHNSQEDLDEGIECAEAAVQHTEKLEGPSQQQLLVQRLTTLSHCRFTKAYLAHEDSIDELLQSVKDAERATEIMHLASLQNENKLQLLATYSTSLHAAFERSREWAYLRRSLDISQNYLHLLATAPPSMSHDWKANYAFRLLYAFQFAAENSAHTEDEYLSRGDVLRQQAIHWICEAMKIETERPHSKIENAVTFVSFINKLPLIAQRSTLAACADFLRDAVDTLVDIATLSNSVSRRSLLLKFYGLSRYAASAFLADDRDPFLALEVLERGRQVTRSIELDNESYSETQSEDVVEFQSQFLQARQELLDANAQYAPYNVRAQKLEALRNLREQGLSKNFLLPNNFTRQRLLQLAQESDIVVVNITDIASDAIIVSKSSIRSLSLPLLREESLSEQSWIIQQAIFREAEDPDDFQHLWTSLSNVLSQLWKQIAKSVLDELGYKNCPKEGQTWPHVWWIPTGVLSLYPLHAAGLGLHTTRNVINRVISSYSSTISSAFRQQDPRHISSSSALRMTAIAMANTPGYPDLEYVWKEINVLRDQFPEAEVLDHPNTDRVLHALQRQDLDFYHFSCHGDVDFEDPSNSIFLMSDWKTNPLTLKLIRSEMTAGNKTAFLSACFTAHAGVEGEQDEGNSLANAMQVAGFSNVIGSLWFVREESVYSVVKGFYKCFNGNATSRLCAEALHFAILSLAKESCSAGNDGKGNPVLWAPFVHYGILS